MSGSGYKPNVLIVHNRYRIPGGEDTVVANEKRMLERHGHKVVLYIQDNSELKEFSILQKLMLPFTSIFNWKTYKDVKRIIREQHIDIVHVHNTLHLISPSVYYAAIRCGTPVVQTIHNFRLLCPGATFYRDEHICEECVENGLLSAVRHKCYRGSRMQTLACVVNIKYHRWRQIYGKLAYICLTGFNKQKLSSFKGILPERIFVKPNFVESLGKIIPAEERQDYFIYVGRLEKIKGVDVLLHAWRRMGNRAPGLLICGTGSMEGWCRRYIWDNHMTSVEIKGLLPNIEARKLIASSKALILPTRWYEGFPVSIVEAYSAGTPVITSDLGNAGSLVIEGVTGSKFEAGSPERLVESVHWIRNHPDIYSKTETVYREKYTAEENYRCLMRIYRAVDSGR